MQNVGGHKNFVKCLVRTSFSQATINQIYNLVTLVISPKHSQRLHIDIPSVCFP